MLYASFAKPIGMFDNFFNKAVAWITGGEYCHCEFIFSYSVDEFEKILNNVDGHTYLKKIYSEYIENETVNICFYVIWGDKVSYRLMKHTHNNPFYRMPNDTQFKKLSIEITPINEEKMISFLFKQCGKYYDYQAALGYFIPFRPSMPEYPKYFCSQLMLTSFHQIQMYRDHNPASITPNGLYKILN